MQRMKDRIFISYKMAKAIIRELLDNDHLSSDQEVLQLIGNTFYQRSLDTPLPLLSKVIVDKSGRLFLPNYSKEEVEMKCLFKVFFVFFLIHAEGVSYQGLSKHKEELFRLYQFLSKKNLDAFQMKNTIEKLVSEGGSRSSVYTICSNIRSALLKVVPSNAIDLYSIEGGRGALRKISIDRNWVNIQWKDSK